MLSSLLFIADNNPDPARVQRRFRLSDQAITKSSTLEEFDQRFSDDYFDMIVVDQDLLSGPTNSTMADLQMLSQQSSSLVITRAKDFVRDARTDNQHDSKPASSPSEDSNGHLEIISQSVRCISHESRNVLQRIQMRIESLEKKLEKTDPKENETRNLKLEFAAIHQLFETTRLICNPIHLDLKLAKPAIVVEESCRDLMGDFGLSVQFELNLQAEALAWIDLDAIKTVISMLLQYLVSYIESPLSIRVVDSVCSDESHRYYRLSFESDTKPIGKKPNDQINLAFARRIALQHGGHLEIANPDRGPSACVLTLPLG